MTTHNRVKKTRQPRDTESACILRWVFHRGSDALTCAVEVTGDQPSYEVCVLPHWNLFDAAVEHFEAPESALRRHAEIALHLRRAGWVAQYGASHSPRVAA
jgi:hypothetical protein